MNSLLLLVLLAAGVTADIPADKLVDIPAEKLAAIKDRFIVIFEDDVDVDELVSSLEFQATSIGGKFDVAWKYRTTVKGMAVTLNERSLKLIRRMPGVRYIETDTIATLFSVPWGLDRIDQRDLPLNNGFDITGTGAGVTIYVIDTGVRDTHEEFTGRARQGPVDFVGDGANGYDCYGHGTHCAGTAAGAIHGIARDAQIVSVRIFDCDGIGTAADVVAAIDHTTANAVLPAVFSMSFGVVARKSVDEAVDRAVDRGIVAVAAAGNSDGNACVYSPSRSEKAISVAASDSSDTRAYFSSYGECVEIFAPGINVESASPYSDSDIILMDGTSVACPHVAGVAAIHLGNGIPAADVRKQIIDSATNNRLSDTKTGTPNKLLYI
ncbi:aqualysin-1-like [Diadema antillarum]|uniref:aqualysin-1-like n=1 Tax=Diadema antillarum TaxID=105358 RepID=UPI003A8837B3